MEVFIALIVAFVAGFFVGGRWEKYVLKRLMERGSSVMEKLDAVHDRLRKVI